MEYLSKALAAFLETISTPSIGFMIRTGQEVQSQERMEYLRIERLAPTKRSDSRGGYEMSSKDLSGTYRNF